MTTAAPAPPTGKETTLEIPTRQPSVKGPAQLFAGDVWFDVLAEGEEPSQVRVNTVRFAPGARTAWQPHRAGPTLHVTDGIGLGPGPRRPGGRHPAR
jgi:quercetin dioxygenase-like cupin family protein